MKRSGTPRRGTYWYRALGRLHRYTENMRHLRRSPRERTEQDQFAAQPPPSTAATEPTDPEVFHARRPTPRPSPPYDVPANQSRQPTSWLSSIK